MSRSLLACACLGAALALAACAAPDDPHTATQTLRGRIDPQRFDSTVLGVRVVTQDGAVAASATLAADRSFELAVPRGLHYRIEVVTRAGERPLVTGPAGARGLSRFDVCKPVDPFDMGQVGGEHGSGQSHGSGGGTGPGDDNGGGCEPIPVPVPPPPPCDPNGSGCDDPVPSPPPPPFPGCDEPPPPPPPPGCDPTDPIPVPVPGDPGDPGDDDGGSNPGDPGCPPPPCDPCALDPSLCEDPCGVKPDGTVDPDCEPPWPTPDCPPDEPTCWPTPGEPYCDPVTGICIEIDGAVPELPVPDFGCDEERS